MKTSSIETKPVFKIPKTTFKDDGSTDDKFNFFSFKRKKTDYLKNNYITSMANICQKFKVIVCFDRCGNIREEVVKCLQNRNIKYAKANFSHEDFENNLFSIDIESNMSKGNYLEVNFDDYESANLAYEAILNLKIKDIKLNVLIL